ncbi:MAG: enoyl-CoA hydratase/isomerase family protein [Myxococcota bacterium]
MSEPLLLTTTRDGVTTLTMNMPARLNGWTAKMMMALRGGLGQAAADDATKVVILTGADPYYCAGVNLGAAFKPAHPRTLRDYIAKENAALFNLFIDFPKPILIAVNGPALGASVTSAVLCDAIIASEKASFSTPFGELGVTPEGCSSKTFPALLGQQTADRILRDEGWKPTAQEALDIGLIHRVVPHEQLMDAAHEMATAWIASGRTRTYPAGLSPDDLHAINAEESQALANAFLSTRFLKGRFQFFWRKNKRQTALMFLTLWTTRPVWSLFL